MYLLYTKPKQNPLTSVELFKLRKNIMERKGTFICLLGHFGFFETCGYFESFESFFLCVFGLFSLLAPMPLLGVFETVSSLLLAILFNFKDFSVDNPWY